MIDVPAGQLGTRGNTSGYPANQTLTFAHRYSKSKKCNDSPATRPQIAADGGRDACTSASPTRPALADQKNCADAWCTPSDQLPQSGQSIPTTAPAPLPGRVDPEPQ